MYYCIYYVSWLCTTSRGIFQKGDTKTTLKETNKSNVIIVKEANLPKAIIQDENKFGSLFEYRNTKDTNESEKQMEAINQTARNSKCVESSNNPKKSEKASQHTSGN